MTTTMRDKGAVVDPVQYQGYELVRDDHGRIEILDPNLNSIGRVVVDTQAYAGHPGPERSQTYMAWLLDGSPSPIRRARTPYEVLVAVVDARPA